MAEKPTYVELGQRVKELEKSVNDRLSLENQLKLLSVALNQSSEGVAVVDMDGNLKYLNHAFAEMHGYSATELVGKNLSIFHTQEQMPHVEAANSELKQKGSFTGKIWHAKRDGTVFPTIMHNTLIRDETNKPIGIMGTIRDITDLKQKEEALHESEERFAFAIRNSNLGVWDWNVKTGGLVYSEHWADMLEYEIHELEPNITTFESFLHPEDKDRVMESLIKHFKNDDFEYNIEFRMKTKSGGWRWINSRGRVVDRDKEKKALRMVGTNTDITDRKRAEKKLERSEIFLNTVFDSIQDGISVLDQNLNVIRVNQAMNNWYSHMVPLEGKKCYEVYHGRSDACDLCPTVRALKTGKLEMNEVPLVQSDGRTGVLELFAFPMLSESGKPTAVVEYVRDISERRRAVEELRESEEKFRKLVENLNEGIYSLDTGGVVTYVNPAIEKILGYESAEIVNRPFIDFVYEEDLEYLKERFKTLTLGPGGNEYRLVNKNGEARWIHSSTRPIFSGDKHIGFEGVLFDITEHRRAEEELRESEEKFKILFENAPDAYYLNEFEGNFIDGNKATEELLGYKRDELIGKSILEAGIVPPDQIQKAAGILKKGFKGHSVRAEALELIRKDGSRISVEVSAIPLKLKGKEIFVGIVRDITERKRLEESLSQAQKMEAIGTLAGGIAHDFNNILFPLVGYAEMLKEDLPGDHPFRANADAMLQAALRAKDLVQQILTFSRKSEAEIKPIKLQPVVKEALKFLRSSIPKSIDIQQNIDPHCGVINADPTEIHQIVMNLVTNSYHAMENSGGKLTVKLKQIRIEKEYSEYSDLLPGTYAQLTIADTGIGMEKKLLDRVFDPYFTTKENGKGTGLGLSVVHGIIKKSGGDIRLYSEPGKGTDIHVYLPVIESKAEKRVERSEPIPGGTERILLVDDEEAIISMEQQLLERLGYNVTIRTGSLEALEAFKANSDKFDLIITDMTMPNMTGTQLAREIKKIKATIPIIICTGFSNQLTDEKCRALGIQGYIMKPVVIRELADTIRKALEPFEES